MRFFAFSRRLRYFFGNELQGTFGELLHSRFYDRFFYRLVVYVVNVRGSNRGEGPLSLRLPVCQGPASVSSSRGRLQFSNQEFRFRTTRFYVVTSANSTVGLPGVVKDGSFLQYAVFLGIVSVGASCLIEGLLNGVRLVGKRSRHRLFFRCRLLRGDGGLRLVPSVRRKNQFVRSGSLQFLTSNTYRGSALSLSIASNYGVPILRVPNIGRLRNAFGFFLILYKGSPRDSNVKVSSNKCRVLANRGLQSRTLNGCCDRFF